MQHNWKSSLNFEHQSLINSICHQKAARISRGNCPSIFHYSSTLQYCVRIEVVFNMKYICSAGLGFSYISLNDKIQITLICFEWMRQKCSNLLYLFFFYLVMICLFYAQEIPPLLYAYDLETITQNQLVCLIATMLFADRNY